MAINISSHAYTWLARVPSLINILLVIMIGLAAARMFWLLWPTPESSFESAPGSTNSAVVPGNGSLFDISTIANANLFGKAMPAAAAQEHEDIVNAPETRLDLTLTGVVSDRVGDRSHALIKNEDGEQGSYSLGDTIIDGVKLHDIYVSKVILERNGRYETLTLESIKNAKAIQQVTRQTISDPLARQLGKIRTQILANPALAQRYIRLQPARQNGKLIGYRIQPGPDQRLFKQAGLQSGAIVTAINGQSLRNPAQALRMLSQIATATSVALTLLHDGQQHIVTVRFQ